VHLVNIFDGRDIEQELSAPFPKLDAEAFFLALAEEPGIPLPIEIPTDRQGFRDHLARLRFKNRYRSEWIDLQEFGRARIWNLDLLERTRAFIEKDLHPERAWCRSFHVELHEIIPWQVKTVRGA